jgi:hypothetical protein
MTPENMQGQRKARALVPAPFSLSAKSPQSEAIELMRGKKYLRPSAAGGRNHFPASNR